MLAAKVPAGFGFPLASNEPLLLFTQVLNLNIQHPQNIKVRHRVTIDYVRARDLTTPIKPLFNVGASGMVILDDNPLALAHSMMSTPSTASVTTEAGHATMNPNMSCLVGSRAPQATSGSADYTDPQGRKMTGHWIVPPGKQVNHSDITWFMNLQYDTRLRYAAVHLHPFAKSLEMRDMTTGKTVFVAKAENPATGVGLTHVDEFSSPDGVLLQHAHKYSLISTYDNPTNANADSMASVFLGLDDPELTIPTSDQLARTSAALFNSKSLVLHTNIGDITATFDREHASETVIQVARFALAGALDATRMIGPEERRHRDAVGAEGRTADAAVPLRERRRRGGRERCRTASAAATIRSRPSSSNGRFRSRGQSLHRIRAHRATASISSPRSSPARAQRWRKRRRSAGARIRRRSPRSKGVTGHAGVCARRGTRDGQPASPRIERSCNLPFSRQFVPAAKSRRTPRPRRRDSLSPSSRCTRAPRPASRSG